MIHIKRFNENFNTTNENLFKGVKKWWNKPIEHDGCYGESPKDWYDWNGRLGIALLTMGANLLIEYGYKSIVYLIEKYGKELKNVIKKIKYDDVISQYLKDPNFKIDLSEEPYYTGCKNSSKFIVNERLRDILTNDEFKIFIKFIYESQKILKDEGKSI